jgi:hypothetical protein
MGPVTMSRAHRDAVYGQIVDRLSGIEDIWATASREEYEIADRLAREFSDELRLVVDDLGWGDGGDVESIDLVTAPEVLRRVLGRLQKMAASERASRQEDWDENRDQEERNRLVTEACQVVLAALPDGEENG